MSLVVKVRPNPITGKKRPIRFTKLTDFIPHIKHAFALMESQRSSVDQSSMKIFGTSVSYHLWIKAGLSKVMNRDLRSYVTDGETGAKQPALRLMVTWWRTILTSDLQRGNRKRLIETIERMFPQLKVVALADMTAADKDQALGVILFLQMKTPKNQGYFREEPAPIDDTVRSL